MKKQTIYISNSSNGIGDHVTGLYAAKGFANSGHKVYYITKYAEWFRYVVDPLPQSDLHIVAALSIDQMESTPVHIIDCHHGYKTDTKTNHLGEHERALQGELKHRVTRYIENISKGSKIKDTISPARLEYRLFNQPKPEYMVSGNLHAVLAPISSMKERDWALANYARLARLLIAEGWIVHLLAMPEHSPAILQVFNGIPTKAHFGLPVPEVLNILDHADVFVGNDSGMAHISEMMGSLTFPIMSQYSPEFVFGTEDGIPPWIKPITPDPKTTCAPCYIKSKDYTTECHRFGCGALNTILPQQVMNAIKTYLQEL